MKQLFDAFSLQAMSDLVLLWVDKGANLALAEPFVLACAESMTKFLSSRDPDWQCAAANQMLRNSTRPLTFNRQSTVSSFMDQFLGPRSRWETLGIFISAVIRATTEIPFFPSLYKTEKAQMELRRLATNLNDCAMEICLALDCLNDLQFILQFENFIVHTYVRGDQSKSNPAC
jgi:hypothetical protein